MESPEKIVKPEVGSFLDEVDGLHATYYYEWLETHEATPDVPEWSEIVKALRWAYLERTKPDLLERAGDVLFEHLSPGLLIVAAYLKALQDPRCVDNPRIRARIHHQIASDYYYDGAGQFLEALGLDMLQEATKESRKAIELDPENMAYRHHLVVILHQGMADHAAAVAELEKMAALDPDGNSSEAERAQEGLKYMRPLAAVVHELSSEARHAFGAGLAHHRAGKLQEAIHEYETAIQLAPNYVPAYRYGVSAEVQPNVHYVTDPRSAPYMDIGALSHALRSNKDALAVSLADDIHLCLALALIRVGDRERAVAELRKVIGRDYKKGSIVDWDERLAKRIEEIFGPEDEPTSPDEHCTSEDVAAVTTEPPTVEWPMFGGNPARTGVAAGLIEPPLRLLWEFPTESFLHAGPVVSDGRVFFGTHGGTIHALDAVRGAELWKRDGLGMIVASAAVHDGMVIFAQLGGCLRALEALSGKDIWDYEGGGDVFSGGRGSHPLVGSVHGKGVVLFPGDDLAILKCINGERIGGCTGRGGGVSTPALDNDIVYVALSRSILAFDVQSGRQVWGVSTGDYVRVGPVVSGELLFYGTKHNTMCARSVRDGELVWKFQIERESIHLACEGIESSPVVAGDLVCFGGPDGWLYALDAESGEERWSFEAGNEITANPVVSGDNVYFGAMDGALRCLHTDTGSEKWRYDAQAFKSGPVISGQTLYCGSKAVYAFIRA